jgi:alpha-L-rhamnosidase
MNHIMFGEVSAWFYKALGGIFPDEAQPGFKNVILRPHFVEQLDHFGASYTSVYGTLTSSWKREEGKIRYEVVIPANTTATIFLEGNKVTLDQKDVLKSNFLKAKQEGKGFVVDATAGTYLFVVEG